MSAQVVGLGVPADRPEADAATCGTCGAELVERDPAKTTPEQRWCGTWLDHPPIPGLPSGALIGHTGSRLIPSAELADELARQDPKADPDPLVCRNARAARFLPTCGEPTDAHCPTCWGCPGDCDCPDFAPADQPPITFTAKETA